MKRTAKWQRTLTLKQLRHMKKWQSELTLRAFRRQREYQKGLSKKDNGYEMCFECQEIERRLILAGAMKEE